MKTSLFLIISILIYNFSFAYEIQNPASSCAQDETTLRNCSDSDLIQSNELAQITLCQNKSGTSKVLFTIISKEHKIQTLELSGSLNTDRNKNLEFRSDNSSPHYKIYFTNDHDEAYLDIFKREEQSERMTFSCQ